MVKRILIITQWFDPEPTFKGLLFAKELASRGFDVEVLTGFPNYPGGYLYRGYKLKLIQKEIIDGVLVTRVPLFPSHNSSKLERVLNYLTFAASSLIYGLIFAKRPDVIYAYHPPLTVGISAIIVKFFRRIPVVLDIQDIWPDTLKATGMISNERLLYFISKICNLIYRSVTQIVVLSPGFKNLLVNRGVCADKIEVIYNWADETALRNIEKSRPKEIANIEGFTVLFAGNVGRAQGLGVVLDAALLLREDSPKVFFVILGNGLMLSELKTRATDLELHNVCFVPAVSMERVGSFLNAADALLVHLTNDPLFRVTIPSKTQAYMAIGKPMIMGVGGDAENLVLQAKCGQCIDPDNAASLADATRNLLSLSPKQLTMLGNNGASFYKKNLSVKVGVDAFIALFTRVINCDTKNT